MSEQINRKKEQIWNERFDQVMRDRNLSQRKFIELYRAKFKTGSQADVSNWLHIGDIDGRTQKERHFPKFETMRNIAEILGVSVGYLIGETDFETFEMERAVKYIGLSSESINSIKGITSGKVIPPFYKYPDSQTNAALEGIVTNNALVEYLKSICKLAEAINRNHNPKNNFQKALDGIPEVHKESVFELWRDSEEAIKEKGVIPNDYLWELVNRLENAACLDMMQPDMLTREINAAKYAVQEAHSRMIDELMKSDRFQLLLPHYATPEEIETIISGK